MSAASPPMYLLARMTPSASQSPQPSRVAIFFIKASAVSASPQRGLSPSSLSGVRMPFSTHSVTQPSTQPSSLTSKPSESHSFESMTVAPPSVTPIWAPIEAMPSYSGSSPEYLAYGPSVTVITLQQAIWQAQQGFDFHSKLPRMYWPLIFSCSSKMLVV